MRLVVFIAVLALASAEYKSYHGYKVVQFTPKTHQENVYFKSLANIPDFDFWTPINKVGNPVTVLISPKVQVKFLDYLKVNNIDFEILIDNVGNTFEEEQRIHRNLPTGRISFDNYQRHAQINEYLAQLSRDHSDIAKVETIGKSYEGRSLNIIKISTGPSKPAKPVIFVDAGIHAREWIAPAVATYLIHQLVENATNKNLIENIDWIILPSVNPDGYEYTWTRDRMWRKTRSPGILCDGCDPNRNFDFHWMETGATSWECSETYAGPKAFSEVETQHLRDYILKTPNIKAYLTLHSYGQYLLYPWGYTSSLPSNWKELDTLAHKVNDAIRSVSGTKYTIGSSTNVLYAAAGASDDWAMGVAGIDIVYTIELPGGGRQGFDLPANRIKPVSVETFEGFKVFAEHVQNKQK